MNLTLRAVSNVVCVLTNSSVIPFRWHQNKFKCFFCPMFVPEAAILREHTRSEHSGANVDVFVKHNMLPFSASSVKLDISNITCKLCSTPLPDLDGLIQHLIEKHKVKYDRNVDTKMLPFNLSRDLECSTCHEKFDFFGPLLIHTNKHSANWPCEICGAIFTSKFRVSRHIYYSHKSGGYTCRMCNETFATKGMQRFHEATHKVNAFKCGQCSETFQSAYKRRMHMVSAHNQNLEHECTHCDKVFMMKNQLLIHVKRMHLREKNHFCDVCGDRFFNKHSLKLHMVRHVADKTFACEICKKSFARKKNLELHVRIHTNDRRYACKLCGKAFIQTTSLKLHLRVHHPNLN